MNLGNAFPLVFPFSFLKDQNSEDTSRRQEGMGCHKNIFSLLS